MWIWAIRTSSAGFVDETPEALALAGASSTGAAMLDVEGDGDLDLVVPADGALRLILGDGSLSGFVDETESRAPALADAGTFRGVYPVDIDHDGDMDLLRAEVYELTLLRNSGPPDYSFEVGWSFSQTPYSSGFEGGALLDADGDGWIDLLLAEAAAANWILANPGDGSIDLTGLDQAPLGMTLSATNSDFATAGDWDLDGDIDVVIRGAGEGPDAFLADGTSWTAVDGFDLDALNEAKGSVSLCDLDADGTLELYWTSPTAPALQGFLWTGSSWELSFTSDAPSDARAALCGDLDADGTSDLWIQTGSGASVLYGGSFSLEDQQVPGGATASLCDLDADGDLDVHVASAGETSSLLRNDSPSSDSVSIELLANVSGCPSDPVLRADLGASVRALGEGDLPYGSRFELSGGTGRGQIAAPAMIVGGVPASEVVRFEVDFQYGGEGPLIVERPAGVTRWELVQDDPDADGIPTEIERSALPDGYDLRDTDNDGLLDWADPDADNDTLTDAEERGSSDRCAPLADNDADSIPDLLDPDSDGDGILDIDDPEPTIPADPGTGTTDSTGTTDTTSATDSTGATDSTDTEPVDTGEPELDTEVGADSDGDGIPDSIDPEPLGSGGSTGKAPAPPGCGCAAGPPTIRWAFAIGAALSIGIRSRRAEVSHR